MVGFVVCVVCYVDFQVGEWVVGEVMLYVQFEVGQVVDGVWCVDEVCLYQVVVIVLVLWVG